MAGEASAETAPGLPAAPSERLPATTEQVPGAQKAAVLMAALGSERAANVLQRLGEAEIEGLSMEMARLSPVGAETTQSIFSEVVALVGDGDGVAGGLDFARGVIERALGPQRAAGV